MQTQTESITRRGFLAGSLTAAAVGRSLAAEPASRPASRPADRWQVGCYTRPWAAHEYPVALEAIAKAGYRYAGLMTTKGPGNLVISFRTTPEQARKVLADVRTAGLKVVSIYGGDIPMESKEKAAEGLKRLIDNCAAFGPTNLLMGGVGDEKQKPLYYGAIAECCDYAVERKVGLSVKPHGGLNATGPQCRKLIEQVGHRNFRLWYDPGNIFYYSDAKLDPVNDAADVDGLVVGMSVKDYIHPRNVDVTPGDGKVDFAKVMARLRKGGFDGGPLVIETLAPGDVTATIAQARKAREFVERLVG